MRIQSFTPYHSRRSVSLYSLDISSLAFLLLNNSSAKGKTLSGLPFISTSSSTFSISLSPKPNSLSKLMNSSWDSLSLLSIILINPMSSDTPSIPANSSRRILSPMLTVKSLRPVER
ncbi:116aa long hypothetical protein [Pyrococcus horikoshii OT3]|uniref:Uncharacterized protein n=1 Tax=Pyrococcus horikoshii (strain ATCC 700860 / DSM 12428 / JCM 9974 / NBRC 100139 / OT-3) TaxID=70601 RepID=O58029_PYRHO|nr:116aa long hypothetical protein [Pyrococcus horikoshii OT3]